MAIETLTGAVAARRIGIDLGGTKTEIAVLDGNRELLWRRRIPTPSTDYAMIVSTITGLVHEVDLALGVRLTIGIGAPGSISKETGRVKNSNTTCMNDQPFAQDLELAIGRPVRVSNDANCFTLSEAIDGAACGAPVVFGVILGTGVGGGIVIDGKVLDGPNGICGEWGHNPLPWITADELPGPACYCGKSGCIETFCSGAGLARTYASLAGRELSGAEIGGLLARGDEQAQRAMAIYEDRLARGLASVINILDPDVVVLGGGLSNLGRLYEHLPGLLERYVFSDTVRTRIVPARHGDSGGVRGAAWLWGH